MYYIDCTKIFFQRERCLSNLSAVMYATMYHWFEPTVQKLWRTGPLKLLNFQETSFLYICLLFGIASKLTKASSLNWKWQWLLLCTRAYNFYSRIHILNTEIICISFQIGSIKFLVKGGAFCLFFLFLMFSVIIFT